MFWEFVATKNSSCFSGRWRSLSRNIGFRPYPLSWILEWVNPLALQNGHFTQSRMASEKIKHYTHFV